MRNFNGFKLVWKLKPYDLCGLIKTKAKHIFTFTDQLKKFSHA